MSISKSTKGSIAELRVATNLMSLGWSVYRNVSPNGLVDMIALKGRTVLRVQVKSSLNGQHEHLRQGNNDLLGIIDADGQIRYRALSKRVCRMLPACGLARKPKRGATKPATVSATSRAVKKVKP